MRPRQIAAVALVLALTVAAFFGARLFGERDARLNSEYRAEVAAAQIRGRVEQGSFLAESLAQFMLSVAGTRDAGEEFESNASRWLYPAGFPAAAWVEQVPASQAFHLEVSLATRNGSLMLAIRDDGVGGADAGRGSGLVGLQDRVEALGGTIGIDSPPGGGTSLVVTLPLDVESTRARPPGPRDVR